MPDWASEFLTGGFGQGLMVPWNWCMMVTYQLMGYRFDFSEGLWEQFMGTVDSSLGRVPLYSVQDIYQWFLSAGLVLLNLFCLIGFCRQASRIRENVTVEMWIELLIKAVVGNVLMVFGLPILQSLLGVASTTSTLFLNASDIQIVPDNIDVGAVLAYILIGILFVLASIVCGIMIVVTVLSRIIHIHILICMMPIACSTLAGGPEIERSGWAWLRTFLSYCFEVVVIALVIKLGGALNGTLQEWAIGTDGDGWFDGFLAVIASAVYMVFLTVSIKGAGSLLRRAFDLR